MSRTSVTTFGEPGQLWTVPDEDVARQATASLRGYVYQLHQSAAAWISLGPDDALYLEIAEDFAALLRDPGRLDQILHATQVKETRESGAVTLNSDDVIDSIKALFRLRMSNQGRDVRLTFLSTSETGRERKMPLPSGVAGLVAWREAARGGDVAEIRAALVARIESSDLRTFIESSSAERLRDELLAPLTFACGEGDSGAVDEANRNALVELRDEVRSTVDMAHRAYDAVLSHVIKTILGPGSRQLDRRQLIACLERATAIALPSQLVAGLQPAPAVVKNSTPIGLADLRVVAHALLDAGTPPSVALLFPDASPTARAALGDIAARECSVVEIRSPDYAYAVNTMAGLVETQELKHLVIGPPGCGKTHALWRTAEQLLTSGEVIPLFLPAAQLNTWADLVALITSVAPDISIPALLSDARVCVCIDGWSEFATGTYGGERRKALRTLHTTRVLANGKFADVGDTAFRAWSLELLAPNQVMQVLKVARPGEPMPPQPVLDLLGLPLLLSIYVLAGARASAIGELLRQFHDHAARDLPEAFTEALASAVADSSLVDDRSFGRFASCLRARAGATGLAEPMKLLQRLGTIHERAGQALPVHDLYWSWLAGRGLLARKAAKLAIRPLHTRESFALALQSGACADDSDVNAALDDDLVLAAALDRSRRPRNSMAAFVTSLDRALNDPRLAVRSRGGLAALEAAEPAYLRRALDILGALTEAGLHVPDWQRALRPDLLYPQRAEIAEWLGSHGSDLLLDSIAERGGPEWTSWLEQVAINGKISFVDALAAALGCDTNLPQWGEAVLDDLIASKPWKLGAAVRRSNITLARRIAHNYERLVEMAGPTSGTWIHLNRVLVGCGDDDVFRLLLDRFETMAKQAQELLGFAVVERGPPWIGHFQRVAFADVGGRHHHKLAEELSLDIDDITAREWIAAGHHEAGWRVLIARHGEAVLPELVGALPASFAGSHHIPALANMRFLEKAPPSLINELWRRLGGPMQPKAMQDFLNAVATVHPEGVASVVRFIAEQPDVLPAYHLHQAIRLYNEWRKKVGADLSIRFGDEVAQSFPQWITMYSALRRWDSHFTPRMLASSPDLAVDFVLQHLGEDNEKATAVLGELHGLTRYSEALLDRMLAVPALATLIPNVFAGCLESIPVAALLRCVASPHIDQGVLLWKLSATNNPLHRPVHAELIQKVLTRPLDLHRFRYIASMLRAHSRHDVLNLLESAPHLGEDGWVWLAREVETARGERLIDEVGNLLR